MPMTLLEKKKITKNYTRIVKGLITTKIIDHLIETDILTLDDEERINNKPTQEDKARELLRLVLKAPKNGYQPFLDALNDDGYEELAKEINDTEVSDEPDRQDTLENWIGKDRLSPEKEGHVLKDLDLLHFSKAINPNSLAPVGSCLEFSAGDVQSIEYKHVRAPESACHELLVKWRNKNGNKATVRSLLEVLFKAWQILPEAIYEEKVRDSLDRV